MNTRKFKITKAKSKEPRLQTIIIDSAQHTKHSIVVDATGTEFILNDEITDAINAILSQDIKQLILTINIL